MKATTLPLTSAIIERYLSGTGLFKLSRALHINARRLRRLLDSNGITIRGIAETSRGRRHTKETKIRLSKALKGRAMPTGWGQHLSVVMKGRSFSEEHRKKISAASIGRIGSKNSNWRGGVTTINERIRKSEEYRIWRNLVFIRDNYTCQNCGQRGGDIQADHLLPFSINPDLRFNVNNGRTLCAKCHRETPTFSGRIQRFKIQNLEVIVSI